MAAYEIRIGTTELTYPGFRSIGILSIGEPSKTTVPKPIMADVNDLAQSKIVPELMPYLSLKNTVATDTSPSYSECVLNLGIAHKDKYNESARLIAEHIGYIIKLHEPSSHYSIDPEIKIATPEPDGTRCTRQWLQANLGKQTVAT